MKTAIRILLSLTLATTLCAAQTAAPAKPRAKTPPASKPATASQPATAAPATPAAAGQLTPATVESFLKQMFGYDPNLVFKVAGITPSPASGLTEVSILVSAPQGQQMTKLFVTQDQQHALIGDLIPFGADPFADARTKLQGVTGPAKGPKDSPVTIVEFGDLECPACKQAQPTIEKLLGDAPNARLVFANMPLDQLHPWAHKAAAYVDCLQRTKGDDAAWTFITATYSHQGEITEANVDEKLNNYITMAGADPAAIGTCAKSPETEQRIQRSVQLAKDLDVSSTPTLFINGRKINGVNSMPYEILKAMTEFAAQK